MKGLPCVLASAALALTAVSASAEVVMWYRFDELEVGEVAKDGKRTLVNKTNPGTLNMTLGSYSGDSQGTSADLMPYGTNSFGGKLMVYDPLTGNYLTNSRAMYFGPRGSLAGLSSAPGSIAKADGNAIFSRFTNVTVEAIFRIKEDAPSGYTLPIVQKTGAGAYTPPWGLTVNSEGLWQRFQYGTPGGGYETQQGFSTKKAVSRGVWHHAAFTFNAAGQARLYLDYELQATSTHEGCQLEVRPDNSFSIGARVSVANSTFAGEIDEVRICDTALTADQFLRIKPLTDGLDPDTLFYDPLDFEGKRPQTGFGINAVTNANALASTFVYEDSVNGVPEGAADIPGDSGLMRQNVLAPNQTNDGSMYTTTNVLGKGSAIRLDTPDRALYTNSFTAEMFFKGDRSKIDPAGRAITLMWGQLKVFVDAVGGTRARAYDGQQGYSSRAEISLDHRRLWDDQWHHVAFVYDYEGSNVTYYIDYKNCGTVKNIRLYEKDNGSKVFYFGRQVDNGELGHQFFQGWMDSPRIVKRALRPHEFLTTHPLAAQEKTLAHYTFDTDFSVGPYPSVELAGTPTNEMNNSVTGCGTPVIDPVKKFPKVYLDGEAMQAEKADGGSVRMNGGQIRYPRNDLLERKSFTMEFFARIQSYSGTAQFLRLNRGPSEWNNYSTWAPQIEPNGHLSIHAYTQKADKSFVNASPDLTGQTGKSVPVDDRWHHYAITSEVVDGNTRITAYIDYEKAGEPVVQEGVYYYPPEGTCLSVGANDKIQGWINELRFSDGVLPVSAFMRAQRTGMFLLVR